MAADLLAAVQKVHISSQGEELGSDECIDAILDRPRKQKRPKRAPDDVKKELEEKFLRPSTSFSTKWLNEFQE
jgi:antiviral helicase SKI2